MKHYCVAGWSKINTKTKVVKRCKFCNCKIIGKSLAKELCPDCAKKNRKGKIV